MRFQMKKQMIQKKKRKNNLLKFTQTGSHYAKITAIDRPVCLWYG